MTSKILQNKIRKWIILFTTLLILSGLTAIPIETELRIVMHYKSAFPDAIAAWLQVVFEGVRTTNFNYPFIAYGSDWLAFAHICIAISFFGVYNEPVRNKWIIEWAIICCILVIPLAFMAGPVRSIPWFHQLIDCSFGLFGLIPLLIIRHYIHQLELLNNQKPINQ